MGKNIQPPGPVDWGTLGPASGGQSAMSCGSSCLLAQPPLPRALCSWPSLIMLSTDSSPHTVPSPPQQRTTWPTTKQEMQERQIQSLGWEDPLEEETANHSSILAWRIPWTGEPGGLQCMGSQRVGHDWETEHTSTYCLSNRSFARRSLCLLSQSSAWGIYSHVHPLLPCLPISGLEGPFLCKPDPSPECWVPSLHLKGIQLSHAPGSSICLLIPSKSVFSTFAQTSLCHENKQIATFLNSTPPPQDSTLIWLCSFSNMIYKLTSWAPSAYPSHSLQSVSIQPTPTLPNPVMHFGLISPTLDKAAGTVSCLLLRPQVPSSPQPTPLSPSLAMLISLLALCLSSSKCCSSLLNHFPCRRWFQLPDIKPQLKFPTLRMITLPPSALTYISLLALSMLYLNCSFPWLSLASSWRAERML